MYTFVIVHFVIRSESISSTFAPTLTNQLTPLTGLSLCWQRSLSRSFRSHPSTTRPLHTCEATWHVWYMLLAQCYQIRRSPFSIKQTKPPKLFTPLPFPNYCTLTSENVSTLASPNLVMHRKVHSQQIHMSHCIPLTWPANPTQILSPEHHTVWSHCKPYLSCCPYQTPLL